MILKWAIAAVLMMGEVPMERRLFILDPAIVKTQAECEALIGNLAGEIAKAQPDWTLVAKCVDIEYHAPAKTLPRDKKSEVAS